MMGVYGMLAAGLLLFCLRYLTRADRWSDRAAKISFWSLNIGLAWMAFVNLFQLGIVQLYYAVDIGYWYARSLAFLNLPWVNVLEWARLPGDALFIVGGAYPCSGSAGRRCAIRTRGVLKPNPSYRACFILTIRSQGNRRISAYRDKSIWRPISEVSTRIGMKSTWADRSIVN
jgi:hypothetical protein